MRLVLLHTLVIIILGIKFYEQQKKLDFSSLQFMAESVQGNFTFTVLDVENTMLNAGSANIQLTSTEIPVLGEVSNGAA